MIRLTVLLLGALCCYPMMAEEAHVEIESHDPVDITRDDTTYSPPESSIESKVISAYLSKKFESRVVHVSVGGTEVSIKGKVAKTGEDIFLADIPMETLLGNTKPYRLLTPVATNDEGVFAIRLPRITKQNDRASDRLTSRWQLYQRTEKGMTPISHARYADEVACRSPQLPAAKPATKKGLGGWHATREPALKNELQDLGVSAVTVNLDRLHEYVSLEAQDGLTPFTWQGRTYYADESRLQRMDITFREAEKSGAMVSAILLVNNPAHSKDPDLKFLGHPDANRFGRFAMPNVTSAEGLDYYGAILNLMTERWSRDDGIHGRVHHWIIHNEVDYGWIWTNAGRKTDIEYMDLYQRSMRLTDLIARQYDPNARTWISLTHHWGQGGDQYGYGSKRMLELLVQFCNAEGDFPWAVAHHPYPQNLFNPRTWEDDQVSWQFDTPKITPRNLEVLDAYMKLPAMKYRGEIRPVHLSENGFNSPDYSAQSLEDQAAGMALAWKKIQKLSSIESWQYHNWIDNRHEGGLRLGLRKFRDDKSDRLGKKPIWYLYQAVGTPDENAVTGQYLKTIGIQSWNDVIHTQPIK